MVFYSEICAFVDTMIHSKTRFYIGSIPIDGDLVIAPMDGITDSALRRLLCRHGASLCYTEFINARDVMHDSILFERKAIPNSSMPGMSCMIPFFLSAK